MKTDYRSYLAKRAISIEVIDRHGISFDGSRIAIPVRDSEGTIVFHKYRKDPDDTSDAPKYTYDAGSKVTLFNSHKLRGNTEEVYITEGELDALVLESNDLIALSSTGGAQSFQKDWGDLLRDRSVTVCFDRDTAGAKGLLKVLEAVPHAKVKWLEGKGFRGKDITDFFTHYGAEALTHFMQLPTDLWVFAKGDTREEYLKLANHYLRLKRTLNNNREDGTLAEFLRVHFLNLGKKPKFKPIRPPSPRMEGEIERAKQVPATNFLEFNAEGKAKCLWHHEKTPSLKWYPDDNHLYCFGGCGYKDVIDLVKQKEGVNFKEALTLLKKYNV